MTDLRTLLQEADPVERQPRLDAASAQAIRRAMLNAVAAEAVSPWPHALPVAALVALMLVAGVAAGRRLTHTTPAAAPGELAGSAERPDERRQLQFSTPGGTRIIWTIDPDFELGATP